MAQSGLLLLILSGVAVSSATAQGPGVVCAGDCDRNGVVTVNEPVLAVGIALGDAPLNACPAADANGDGVLLVNELVLGVGNGLNGCPSVATPTSTSGTPGAATPTVTSGTPSAATPTVTSGTPGAATPTPTNVASTPSLTATASATPTVEAVCPVDFEDDNSDPESTLCLFAGRISESCGPPDLEASFVGDSEVVVASLFTDPPIFFGAEVTAPDIGDLIGWFTKEDLSDLVPLAGSVRLVEGGTRLRIEPTESPFDIDGCDFLRYDGGFTSTVPPAVASE